LENVCSYFGKVQQVRRADDASQSLQELWNIQQERDHSAGLVINVFARGVEKSMVCESMQPLIFFVVTEIF
jgi:hypothetical protein